MRHLLSALLLVLAHLAPAMALSIYSEDWPPVSFINSNGQSDGMAVAVVRELQKRTGNQDKIDIQPWVRAYTHLLNEPNVLLFTVGRTPERESKMTLVGPVALSTTDVFALRSEAAAIRRLGDARRSLPTAAYRSSIFESAAREHGYNVSPTNDPQHSARMLVAGRVKLWVEGSIVVPQVLQRMDLPDSTVERIATLETLELYLAFSRGTPRSVILAWEQALRDMKRDGSFQTLHKRWFPLSPVPQEVGRIGLEP